MDGLRDNLTREQVERYFDRIELPASKRHFDVSALSTEDALKYLGELQQHNLTGIPFENLSIHYSPHRQIALGAVDLYKKIIETPGRGGYCMENNSLLALLLRSIGFQCYIAGARVLEGDRYTAWTHAVILVTIADKRYEVDVGFGSNCPTRPLLLDDSGIIVANDGPASIRLVYGDVKGTTSPGQKLWRYQHRINDSSDFVDMYAFTELEFLERDLEMMNYFTSTNPRTIFTQKVVCMKFFRSQSGRDTLEGAVILLNDGIKWRQSGEIIQSETFKSEDDRIEALQKHFGIRLDWSERNGISRMVSEIKP